MPAKNNLRDKLEDDVLDLSLMQLTDVPVNEIVSEICEEDMIAVFWFMLTCPTTPAIE